MTRLTVKERLRAGHVRRWHIVATVREQTIADHMYRVALLTEEVLTTLGLFDWDCALTLNAMEWARVHDLPEVVTGDVPTNAKHLYRSVGVKDAMDQVEHTRDDYVAELADCVAPTGECPLAGAIVKLADLMEAANFCAIFGVGAHADQVWRGLAEAANQQVRVVVNLVNETHGLSSAVAYHALSNLLHEVINDA